jgi:hypothetical protein
MDRDVELEDGLEMIDIITGVLMSLEDLSKCTYFSKGVNSLNLHRARTSVELLLDEIEGSIQKESLSKDSQGPENTAS